MLKKYIFMVLALIIILNPVVIAVDTFRVTTIGTYDFDNAHRVLELVNEERNKVGLNSLKLDTELTELAMQRAAELAIFNNHMRPFDITTVTAGAENIAAGQSTPEIVMQQWMNSPGHKRQIVPVDEYDDGACKSWKSMGIACYDCGDYLTWVQLFSGKETSNEFTKKGKLDKNVDVDVMTSKLEALSNKDGQIALYYTTLGASNLKIKSGEKLNLVGLKFRNLDKNWQNYSLITPESVKFTTTDEGVCSVGSDGTITAVGPGNATITATLGIVQDSVNVKVENPLKSISLPSSINITNNKPQKLSVTYNAENPKYDTTDNKDVVWKSLNPSIADVDNDGNVTGYRAGSTQIVATVGDLTATCNVTVTVEIEKIELYTSRINTYKNQTIAPLTVKYYPEDSSNKGVTWSTDREDIVSIDPDGTMHTKASGTAIITATTKNGKTASCSVNVSNIRISLNYSRYTIDSMTEPLKLTASLSDGGQTTINWSSSCEDIITVDDNGNVTPKRGGIADIIAESSEYGTASCEIYVRVPIELEDGSKAYTGDLNKDGVFDSQDIDEMTKIFIKGKSTKYELFLADLDNNGVVDTADIALLNNIIRYNIYTPGEYRHIESINFKDNEITLNKDETRTILPIITPEDTTDSTRLTFNSNNDGVVQVEKDGKIIAKKQGTAIITASLSNGMSANYTVKVNEYKKGDVDKSGVVDAVDASKVLTLFKNQNATQEELYLGDVDGTPGLSAVDAMTILTAFKNKTSLD